MEPIKGPSLLTARPGLVLLLAFIVGLSSGSGVVAYASSTAAHPASKTPPSWCPFDVSFGMEIMQPGNTGNASPNATTYANGSVVFSGGASGCIPPYTFRLAFGDGNASTNPNVVHVYTHAGYFPGSLTVWDSGGHTSAQNYFCIDAHNWPALGGSNGNPAPPCP